MLKRLTILLTALLFGLFMFTACDDDSSVDPTPPAEDPNIVETAEEDGNFTILLELAEEAGIADVLANEELTVFAPTDAAFNALPDDVLESLDAAQIIQILEFHLVDGVVASGDIAEIQDTPSVQGELLLLQNDGSNVVVNGSAGVTTANIEASNGMIHKIDEVLLPSQIRLALEQPNMIDFASQADGFDTLLEAINATGLTTTLQFLGPFTAFAPLDQAFDEVDLESFTPEQIVEILTYHVIEGEVKTDELEPTNTFTTLQGNDLSVTVENGEITLNDSATVVQPDVDDPGNGIIHVINAVLMPE